MKNKTEQLAEPKLKDGPVFTLTISQKGDEVTANTEFVQKISGREVMYMMKMSVQATLQTAQRLGAQFGLSDEEVINYIFPGE